MTDLVTARRHSAAGVGSLQIGGGDAFATRASRSACSAFEVVADRIHAAILAKAGSA